jgi:excisionase family DNA binding protein
VRYLLVKYFLICRQKSGSVDTLLTVRQLQERLQVDRITIYRMLANGRLNGVKVGGQWRFREEDVLHLVSPSPAPPGGFPGPQPTLPLPCLQAMQELFSEAAGVAAVVVDLQGEPLTEFNNDCAFCRLVLSSEVGRQRCVRSWAGLADGMHNAARLHRCHAGLLYACTTIHVDSQPLAAVVGGQRLSDSDPGEGPRLPELAKATGLSPQELQEAYRSIPRLGQADLDKMLHLLSILGVAACRIGSERQRLVAKLDRIAEITLER